MTNHPALAPVLDRLRKYRQETGLSYSALAKNAGLSRAALLGMDDEDWGPTSATIRAIEGLIPAGWVPAAEREDAPKPDRPKRRRPADDRATRSAA